MRIALIYIIIQCIILATIAGQSPLGAQDMKKRDQKKYDKVVEWIREGQNEKAIDELAQLMTAYPGFVEGLIRMGELYYIKSNFEQARKCIEKAIQLDPDFDNRLYLTLAAIQRVMEDYTAAIDNYQIFLSHCTQNSTLCQRITRDKEQCEFIVQAMESPVEVEWWPLKGEINTADSEYLTSFDINGTQLIFTRRHRGQEDLYMSWLVDGEFGKTRPITSLNTMNNEGAHCLSADGKVLIFTACNYRNSYGGCDLYYSVLEEGRWASPKNLGPNINSRFWESQPSLSADGKNLYFASNRPGGLGGNDIYVSEWINTREWSAPINLGDPVNTKQNESSPFIHQDNITLYFRSDRHPGMGKNDLYLATRNLDLKTFGEVRNLGYPINTIGDEGALTVSMDGTRAFFAKEVTGANGEAHLDIFSFEMPDHLRPKKLSYARFVITDQLTLQPVNAKLMVVDNGTKDTVFTGSSSFNQERIASLLLGSNYFIQVEHPEYLYHSEYISLDSVFGKTDPMQLHISLIPISKQVQEINDPIALNNIFFETNSDSLLQESRLELESLSNFLEGNPSIRIKIIGHTDEIGNEGSNLDLSERRALSVYNALIELGIQQNRLQYEGRGESEPITSNETAENRRKNRRTEFIILNN